MIIKSRFKPARGLSHHHIQTLLPTLLKRKSRQNYHWQELTLPDGDFVDLCWNQPPDENDKRPIVIVFHGLEGSINSPYAQQMMQALQDQNWNAVLMHFRGCSGRANKLPRSYHSGDTADARYFIEYLQKQYPGVPIAAVGYSLGGNMLLKLQAELGDASPLAAAVSICAPIELDKCADRINYGFSKIYQRHLMQRLVRNLLRKYDQHDFVSLIKLTKEKVHQLKTFWQFDDAFTAPVHGFGTAKNYYKVNSARGYLSGVTRPTLLLQAEDDPFMTSDVIPDQSELGTGITLEVSENGGHVGFVTGSLLKPHYWLTERVPDFLSDYI